MLKRAPEATYRCLAILRDEGNSWMGEAALLIEIPSHPRDREARKLVKALDNPDLVRDLDKLLDSYITPARRLGYMDKTGLPVYRLSEADLGELLEKLFA